MTDTSNAPLSTALSIKQYDLKPNHLLPAENVNGKEGKFAQDDYDSQGGDISIISDGENVANNKVGVNHDIEDGGDNTIESQDSESDGENIDGASIDSNDGNGSNNVHNREETPDSKRILLQRFTIYNSASTMYIVGSNAKESLYRVMEISTDPEDETNLTIVEDKSYFYTRKDLIELLNGLNESIEGGIHKLAHGYGLLGLIRFTKGYYMCLITKCSQVAILGGHFIYHIDETKLIPLGSYRKPEKYSDEERLLSIFRYMDLSKTFYFSYNYDITNSLQTNLMRQKLAGKANAANKLDKTKNKNNDTNCNCTFINNSLYNTWLHNERFVWNKVLLKPLLQNEEVATFEWFQPIVHGFIDQANISIYGKKFYITIIARRSHHFAGARFLKRGINNRGNVANEIETEQIVSDMMTSSFHDPQYGMYNNPRYTSFVQHRGSIPVYWTQEVNKIKPPIQINMADPFYQSSALHFDDLFYRYGSPIIILNLIKQKEKQPRELKLNLQYIACIKYLNQFLPLEHRLIYHSFDMSKHSKKNLDVITPLQKIAHGEINRIGIFHNGTTLATTKLQRGIIRTNCIDCLDRTNAAQFIICKEALTKQLQSLNLISNERTLDYDSDLVNILTEIFHDHGDTIAIQYGGSNLVNTMDSYRRINQWSSHTRDMLNSIKRMYSNSFIDTIRQEAINLFLGNYVYHPDKPKLWELSNDFALHNDLSVSYGAPVKRSYRAWYKKENIDENRFIIRSGCQDYGVGEPMRETISEPVGETVGETAGETLDKTLGETLGETLGGAFENEKRVVAANTITPLDMNDKWFNECYVPRKYQSFKDLFLYNMNSNSRYFPLIVQMHKQQNSSSGEAGAAAFERLGATTAKTTSAVTGGTLVATSAPVLPPMLFDYSPFESRKMRGGDKKVGEEELSYLDHEVENDEHGQVDEHQFGNDSPGKKSRTKNITSFLASKITSKHKSRGNRKNVGIESESSKSEGRRFLHGDDDGDGEDEEDEEEEEEEEGIGMSRGNYAMFDKQRCPVVNKRDLEMYKSQFDYNNIISQLPVQRQALQLGAEKNSGVEYGTANLKPSEEDIELYRFSSDELLHKINGVIPGHGHLASGNLVSDADIRLYAKYCAEGDSSGGGGGGNSELHNSGLILNYV